MKVRVELQQTSQAIELEAKNTYTKGPFYCVYTADEKVQKFPLDSIFRVTEAYGTHA